MRSFLHSLPNFARKPRQNFYRFMVLGIILIASVMRVKLYGNPTLSIATNDTISYVEASRAPVFSSEIMTGRRLLTTNLLYKIFEPKAGYQILANGSSDTTRRIFQPGFDRIVILQFILSILGWGFLAFTLSKYITNPFMKILGAITIIVFAFTPQIADWDSILMSESLTFSLFALQLAILTKLAFAIYKDQNSNIALDIILWGITYFLWSFLRGTNAFASFITAGMIIIPLFSVSYRKNKYLYGILAFVTITLFLALTTSSNRRSGVEMVDVYMDDLLPNPASVSTLKELGMPEPDTADYKEWFQENSAKTFIKFMFIHPGYPTIKIIRDFPSAFTEIKQTYFKAPELGQARELLMTIGNAIHPENTTPFLLDLFLLIGLILLAVKNVNETSRPWAWLGIWLFLTAGATLIPTILGDTWGLNRHALLSTMIYRLFMWMFLLIIMDIAIQRNTQEAHLSPQPQIQQK